MAGTQDWFAANAPKPAPPPTAQTPAKGADWFAANAPKSDVSTDDSGGLSLQELSSSNPQNEGLYHMKDAQGHSYAVPFSNVESAGDNWRNMFVDEKEAEQYEKDKKYEDSHPSISWDLKFEATPTFGQQLKSLVKHPLDSLESVSHERYRPRDASMGEMAATDLYNVGAGASSVVRHPIKTAEGVLSSGLGVRPVVETVANALEQPIEQREGKKPLYDPQLIPQTPEDAAYAGGQMAAMSGLTEAGGLALEGGKKGLEVVKELPKNVSEGINRRAKNRAGVGIKATEKLVRDTAAENDDIIANQKTPYDKAHAEKVEAVRAQNEADKAEHDKKVEAIRKQNEEEQAAHDAALKKMNDDTSLRTKLSRKAIELKSRIFPKDAPSRLKIIQEGAKQYFNKQYDTLGRLVGKQRGDLTELSTLLDDAEKKIQGSDTNVAVFNDIRKRVNGEISSQTPPAREVWEARSPEEQADWRKNQANAGISYDDLRGYYRELGKLVGSDSTPGDVKTAAGFMRDGLEKMQGDLAEKAGLRAKNLHDKLSKEYKNYAETMLDKSSPVTKMLNAKDADTALKVLEGMTPFQKSYALDLLKGTGEHSDWLRRAERMGEEDGRIKTPLEARAEAGDPAARVSKTNDRLRNMRNYREDTAGLARDYLNTQDQLESIGTPKGPPKPLKITPEPEFEPKPEPKYNPPLPKTIDAAEWRRRMRELLNKKIDTLQANGMKIGPRGLGLIGMAELVTHLTGGGEATMLYVAGGSALAGIIGPKIFARILKMPGVAEKLLTITKADVDQLAKLPANQRVEVEQSIISMTQVAKSEGYIKPSDPTPLAQYAKQDLPKAKEEAAKAKEEPKPEPPPEEPPAAAAPAPEPPATPPASPAAAQPLPGMEHAVAEQHGAAEDFRTEAQKKEAESSLVTPKADISKATGEMERNSPLFRDSEASGQGGLFRENAAPEPAPAPAPQSDVIPSRRLEDLKVDPKRFQYKLGGNKAGVTESRADATWNQSLADPIHIWKDPETGEEFVVNGHHRYEWARRAGAERINIAPMDNTVIKTAGDAREFGALKNIADGNGTSIDAAKFFRENKLGPADLKARGISLKQSVANEGLSLARLSDDIFSRVVDGNLDPKVGAAIGEATESAVDQEAILKDVQRREKQGRPVSAEQIRESARLIKQSPTYTSTTEDLFGNHKEERNLFLEMGEVSEYIQKELADEKRTFGRISTKGASEQLAKGENVINAKKNAEISQRAAQLRELYLKRSAQAGPVHAALQEAAERLAEGGKPNEIKQDALDEIREHLDDELGPME